MNILTTAYAVSGAHAANRAAQRASPLESHATKAQPKPKPASPISRMLKTISNRIQSLVSATGTPLTRKASLSTFDGEYGSHVSLEKINWIDTGDFASSTTSSSGKPSKNFLPKENRNLLHDVYVGSQPSRDALNSDLAHELARRLLLPHDRAPPVFATVHRPAGGLPKDELVRINEGFGGPHMPGVLLKKSQPPSTEQPRHTPVHRTAPPMSAEEIARTTATLTDPDKWSWASGESFLI